VQTEIMEGVREAGGDPDRDAFITWGRHTAINDYRDRRYMFIDGVLQKPFPYHRVRPGRWQGSARRAL
jgi:hypothetical protein